MQNTNEKIIASFLDSKKGTSPATLKHYSARLDVLLGYCKRNKVNLTKFNQKNLIDFLGKSYPKYKPKSMNHLKAVTVSFLKYQFPKDWFTRFPNLSTICKGQKVIPRYEAKDMLTKEDVEKLIQKENDPLWKLIYSMQFYGGCRPAEICSLKWKDVTFADDGVYFTIYSAKNNKKFEKFVPIEFSYYLKELQKTSTSEYCFSKFDNKPIARNSLYVRLTRISKKVFPDKHINPYLLRHSIATILYGRAEKGEISDDVVARQMGHSKSMKDVYTHLDIKTLRENAKKIYVKPDYTPEKKAELEQRIEKLYNGLKKSNIALRQAVEGRKKDRENNEQSQKEIMQVVESIKKELDSLKYKTSPLKNRSVSR